MNLSKIDLSPKFFLVITYVVYFIIYLPQCYNLEQFILDDSLVLTPVLKAKSFLDIYKGDFVDIQPMRDLVFWFDKSMQPYFDLNTFKLSNLIIYALACLMLVPLTRNVFSYYRMSIPSYLPYFITAFILLHPSMTIPIAWMSAKKHLLSFLFILITTNYLFSYLKDESINNFFFICFFFTLSLLSHTINCLWPIWAIFMLYSSTHFSNKRMSLIFSLVLLGLGGLGGVANIIYYKFFLYSANHGGGINTKYTLESLTQIPNSFGRYFINFFDFSAPAIYYDIESLRNLIGFVICILFLITLFNKRNIPLIRSFALLFFVSSFTYTFYLLGTFAQNTYSLFMYVALVFIFVTFLINYLKLKFVKFFFVFVVLLEVIFTNNYAKEWKSNLTAVEDFKSKEDQSEQKAWYILLAIKDRIAKGNFKDTKLLNNMLDDILSIKNYISEVIFVKDVTPAMIFRAYNAYLFYLTRQELLRPEVKLTIINSVCDSQVVYCNYYASLILYQLKRDGLAEEKMTYFLQQIELIIDRALNFPGKKQESMPLDSYSEKNIAFILINLETYLKPIISKKNQEHVEKILLKIENSNAISFKYQIEINRHPKQELKTPNEIQYDNIEKYLFFKSTSNQQFSE